MSSRLDNVYFYTDNPCQGVTYKATQKNKMTMTSKLTAKKLTVVLNSLPQGVYGNGKTYSTSEKIPILN
ncbi:MAG: hypothetical protein GX640_08035 [Fibrobacter sp.]|nr:hypothetical protein [Fibrobacter sp.]